MTEAEYGSLKEFKDLPIYDDDDPACDTIDKMSGDTSYSGVVIEADELSLAQKYLTQPRMIPKGGIRHHGDDGSTIFAYFWEKLHMKYVIGFQYKSPDSLRPEDESASHHSMPLLEQGEFMPIPSPGDSVALLTEPKKPMAFMVLTRHFSYVSKDICIITIVVTDITNAEMAARTKD